MIKSSDEACALANCRPLRAVVCAECSNKFQARDSRAKFCSNRCRQAHKYRSMKNGKKD
jgi:hypothetical protein